VDEDVENILRSIYTAIQRHDWEELGRNVTHDCEFDLPESLPWGGTHHGHLGVETFAEKFAEHVDGIWADPDEVISDDDRVVVLGRISGDAHATGKHFEVPFAHVWSLSDGMPSRLRAYLDTGPILEALRND
jgi:uncharacterized protein